MSANRKKILIVEDNTLNLKLFRDILHAKGFQTIEDRTGRNCLELAIAHKPDLVILDVLLPFASGIELTHQLANHDKTSHIPVVGVTALAITGTLDKMIESGCVDCLIKPFTLDQFIECVESALHQPKKPCKIARQNIDRIKAELDTQSFVNMPLDTNKNALNPETQGDNQVKSETSEPSQTAMNI